MVGGAGLLIRCLPGAAVRAALRLAFLLLLQPLLGSGALQPCTDLAAGFQIIAYGILHDDDKYQWKAGGGQVWSAAIQRRQ